MTDREIKALQIVAKSKLTRKGKVWTVPSQTGHGEYQVNLDPDFFNCTCPDHDFTQARCKHIYAVEYVMEREQGADGQTIVTETVKVTRKTYTQNWPAYNAAQTQEKSKLQALLYELCRTIPEPEQRRGRPRLSLADIIFACTFKIYSTVSGRRFQSDLQEAKRRGFVSRMPSYGSVFRYFAFCRWLRNDETSPQYWRYDWGENNYHKIVSDNAEPNSQDLGNIFDGHFAYLWATSDGPSVEFYCLRKPDPHSKLPSFD